MIPFCGVLNGLGHVHLDVVLCFYQVKDWAVALGHLHPHHHLREEEAVEEHHLSCGARHLYPFPHQETEVGHSPRQLGLEESGPTPITSVSELVLQCSYSQRPTASLV